MVNIAWEDEKKSYETLFFSLTDRKTIVQDARNGELGYTDEYGNIFIAYNDPVFSRLKSDRKKFFRKGVFAHETLHQCFTDFKHMKSVLSDEKYTNAEKMVIGLFANLIEDPAIEYQADSVMGGSLLNALKFTIGEIYKKSPGIENSSTPFAELQNALINFGDLGIVKGHFTNDAAREVFNKIAPEFNAMIMEPVSAKRIDAAVKWMDMSRKLWENLSDDKLKEEIEKIKKENKISNERGTGKQKIVPARKGSDELEERSKELAAGNIEKAEKDANKCVEKIAPESEPQKKEKPSEVFSDFNPEGIAVYTERPRGDQNSNYYNYYLSQQKKNIDYLTRSLKTIFMEDTGGIARKTSGKYNISRGMAMNTVNVFDKRRMPKNLKDMAVFLLVDESGSMSWRNKIETAKAASIILAESFAALHIPCYIMGFTADNKRGEYGPCVTHDHFVTWSNTRAERISLTDMRAQHNNHDAASIECATKALCSYNAEHKLLIVISDGIPAACGCSGKNGVKMTAEAVTKARKKVDLFAIGLGIMEDDARENMKDIYGNVFVPIVSPEQLSRTLAANLKKVIRNW